MERGRIVSEGKHRELLESSGSYRRLIESQALDIGGGES